MTIDSSNDAILNWFVGMQWISMHLYVQHGLCSMLVRCAASCWEDVDDVVACRQMCICSTHIATECYSKCWLVTSKEDHKRWERQHADALGNCSALMIERSFHIWRWSPDQLSQFLPRLQDLSLSLGKLLLLHSLLPCSCVQCNLCGMQLNLLLAH